jgi:hypothetical protein
MLVPAPARSSATPGLETAAGALSEIIAPWCGQALSTGFS